MPRRFLKELGHQETVNEVFLAAGKQLRPNRNGNLYLQVELSDRSGTISARMWNADDQVYRSFENGDFVRVDGATQLFQGAMQLIATHISPVPADEVNQEDFLPLSLKKREALRAKLEELLLGIEQPHIRRIAKAFLADNEFMANFCAAPAGVKHHHAYSGGLLEHVVQLMELCDSLCKFYPVLHRDLLVMGAFLHDTGKVNELGYERDLFYTDAGQLLGHLILGVELLDHKIRDINQKEEEPIPEDMVAELKHLIVSHHGEYEYGSPRLPMTTEAITLHLLDNLDSKLHAFSRLMEDDPNMDSNWTGFQHSMGRKLFKSSSRSWT